MALIFRDRQGRPMRDLGLGIVRPALSPWGAAPASIAPRVPARPAAATATCVSYRWWGFGLPTGTFTVGCTGGNKQACCAAADSSSRAIF